VAEKPATKGGSSGPDNTGAVARRLARLRFDLHDGPAQEVAALLADLRLFEDQLSEALADHTAAVALSGRVADLKSRALALSVELRELARTGQPPAFLDEPIGDVLRAEALAFARATGVEPEVTLSGPVDSLTHSQRIAVLRGVQEALRNAREHARAGNVSVRVEATGDRIDAEVRDDGRGFEVDRALAVPPTGSMGLAAIAERARMLGGRSEVKSRRGGPTSVTISVPRWDPESDGTGDG
jgi:signal transduction histidine kinase